jgi:hypothetical protein
MYVHSSLSDNNNNNHYGIWMDGNNNLVHNNVIHDTMGGIKAETPSSYNEISSNTIYNINWGIFFSGSGSSPNSITQNLIHDNEIYDFANWDTTADTFHHDGLFIDGGNALDTTTYNYLYNNYLHGNGGSSTNCSASFNSCMTAYVYINTESYTYFFNNLLVAPAGDSGPNGGWLEIYADDHDYVFNNTVIGGTTSGKGISGNNCGYFTSNTNLTVENNIFTNCSTLLWNSGSTFTTLDYNVYQATGALTNAWRSGSSYYNTLASWQGASGGDAHSQATTGSLDLSAGYVPQTGSLAIGTATNLTSLDISALDSDKAGVVRPATGSWDAGAYQSQASLDPPTNLTAVPH